MHNHTDPGMGGKPDNSTIALFITLIVLVILIRCFGSPGCKCKRKEVSVYECDDISINSEDNEDEETSLLDSERCSICLSKIKNKYYITQCGHLYHQTCLNRWKKIQTENLECPVCRELITTLEEVA